MKVNHFRRITAPEKRWLALMFFAPVVIWAFWWKAYRSQPLLRFDGGLDSAISGMTFSPDGKRLAVAVMEETGRQQGSDGEMVLWKERILIVNEANGTIEKTIDKPASGIEWPSDDILRIYQNTKIVWIKWQNQETIRQFNTKGYHFAISPDEKWVALERHLDPKKFGRQLELWKLSTNQMVRVLGKTEYEFSPIKFIDGGQKVSAVCRGSQGNNFRVWAITEKGSRTSDVNIKEVTTSNVKRNSPNIGLDFSKLGFLPKYNSLSPNGRWFVVCGEKRAQFRQVASHTPAQVLREAEGHVVVWDTKKQKIVFRLQAGKAMGKAIFSPDGKKLALGIADTAYYESKHRSHIELWPLPSD